MNILERSGQESVCKSTELEVGELRPVFLLSLTSTGSLYIQNTHFIVFWNLPFQNAIYKVHHNLEIHLAYSLHKTTFVQTL
jgi:hypothetical protein